MQNNFFLFGFNNFDNNQEETHNDYNVRVCAVKVGSTDDDPSPNSSPHVYFLLTGSGSLSLIRPSPFVFGGGVVSVFGGGG